jgi:hypothetical protein
VASAAPLGRFPAEFGYELRAGPLVFLLAGTRVRRLGEAIERERPLLAGDRRLLELARHAVVEPEHLVIGLALAVADVDAEQRRVAAG